MSPCKVSIIVLALALLYHDRAAAQAIDARDVSIPRAVGGLFGGPIIKLDKIRTEEMRATIGRGFNAITGEILPTVCVKSKEPVKPLEPGTRSELFFRSVRDSRTNQTASESTFSLGALIKEVSLGFGHSSTASNYFNRVDGFGRIRAQIAVQGSFIVGQIGWSDDAYSLIKDKDRNKLFLQQCGTYFVREVYAGHLMDEWVKFTLQNDMSTRTNGNALSLGVGKVFSAALGGGDAASKVSCYADVTFRHEGLGVLAVPPIGVTSGAATTPGQTVAAPASGPAPATPAAGETSPAPATPAEEAPTGPPKPPEVPKPKLPGEPVAGCSQLDGKSVLQATIDYYNNGFRSAVASADIKAAQPLYIVVDQYNAPEFDLPYKSRVPVWTDGLVQTVARSTDNYHDLISAISDLNFAIEDGPVDRLGVFYQPPLEKDTSTTPATEIVGKDAAKIKLRRANDMFDSYTKAVQKCRDLAFGPEKIGDEFVVDICRNQLNSALNPDLIDKISLVRNYKAETPPQSE